MSGLSVNEYGTSVGGRRRLGLLALSLVPALQRTLAGAGMEFILVRGGSWRVKQEVARTTYRNGYRPDYAHGSISFRLALEVDARI